MFLLDTFIFMLRLCLVSSPSVSKLCCINLVTLLLTRCSAWLRAVGYRWWCPAINKRSHTIAAGERASHHRTDPVLLMGPASSPRCCQDMCCSWPGLFAAVVELLGLLWPSRPASHRACQLWGHRASVCIKSALTSGLPSQTWFCIFWGSWCWWLLKLLCTWSELESDGLEGESDFASCCLSHESCTLPASFLCLELHPWYFPWEKNCCFCCCKTLTSLKERLKANEVFPLRIMHCNW